MNFAAFIGGSNQTQAYSLDVERTINLSVERSQSQGATGPAALITAPGFSPFVGASAGIVDIVGRGGWSDTVSGVERCFMVIGAGLYEITVGQTVTKRAAVTQDHFPATISYNGLGGQLFITSGGNGYNYDLATNVLTQVLTNEATMGVFVHGYFLAFNILNGKVRLSGLNDGTTWDASIFFQRSLFSDPWQAMFVDTNGLVWLPGTKTFEVWNDTGTGTQPFAPLSGLVGLYGLAAPFGFGLAGSTLYWLAQNPQGAGTVVAMKGGQAEEVSTYAVDVALSDYRMASRINDAETLVYQADGHTFVNFSFPSAGATWTLDTGSPMSWTERGVWDSVNGRYQVWAPRVHVDAFGRHLVGSRATGTVAVMDAAYSLELDSTTGIRWQRRTPALIHEHGLMPYDRLELLMDRGLGTSSGQGLDPHLMLRLSNDGGMTWGNERQAATGRMGQYKTRVYWNRLGSARDRVFDVSGSDPVPARIVAAWLNNINSEMAA